MTNPQGQRVVRALVLDHVEAFNAQDRDRLLKGLAEDVVWSTGRDTIRGAGTLAEIFDAGLWAMHPSLTVRHLLVDGDRAAAQMWEVLTVTGEQRRLAIAAFFYVRNGHIRRVKVYREGSADID